MLFLLVRNSISLKGYIFAAQIIIMKIKSLTIFRILAFLEGISYILLLFVAVPIKYWQGDEQYVKLLGMPHGLLFIGYIALAILISKERNWNTKETGIVLLGSIIPLGTFFVDAKYLKNS